MVYVRSFPGPRIGTLWHPAFMIGPEFPHGCEW
jgi:hypothetical protein